MDGIRRVLKLSLLTNEWQLLPKMTVPRCAMVAQVVNGNIFVFGGLYIKLVVGATEMYNVKDVFWKMVKEMPTPRCCMAGATVGDDVWVIGGGDGADNILDIVEIYTASTDSWRSGPKLPLPRAWHAAAAHNGAIFVVGGQDPFQLSTMVQILTISEQSSGWMTLSSPPSSVPVQQQAFAFALVGPFLYLVGGLPTGSYSPTSAVSVYDLDHDAWGTATSLPLARDCASAVFVENRVYVVGGWGVSPSSSEGGVVADVNFLSLIGASAFSSSSSTMTKVTATTTSYFRGHLLRGLAIILAFYFAGGCIYNWRQEKKGINMLPHPIFWTVTLPAVLLTLVGCIVQCFLIPFRKCCPSKPVVRLQSSFCNVGIDEMNSAAVGKNTSSSLDMGPSYGST